MPPGAQVFLFLPTYFSSVDSVSPSLSVDSSHSLSSLSLFSIPFPLLIAISIRAQKFPSLPVPNVIASSLIRMRNSDFRCRGKRSLLDQTSLSLFSSLPLLLSPSSPLSLIFVSPFYLRFQSNQIKNFFYLHSSQDCLC